MVIWSLISWLPRPAAPTRLRPRSCPPSCGRARPDSGCRCPCKARACAGSRILAAVSPTRSLFDPLTVIWVFLGSTPRMIPVGAVKSHGVGLAQGQGHLLARDLGPEAQTHDIQSLGEPGGHALDHVVNARPAHAVNGGGFAVGLEVRGQSRTLPSLTSALHQPVQALLQLALGALGGHQTVGDGDLDARRDR